MATETKAKGAAANTEEMDEIAKMRAEIAALKAEKTVLVAKLEAKSAGRVSAVFPVAALAEPGTSLRYLQDKPRGDVFDAAAKLLRQIPVEKAFALIHGVAESLAGPDKSTEQVIDAAMVKTVRGPRKEKTAPVVGDATEGDATAA